MSKLNEFTIETKLTKKEVIKILKQNVDEPEALYSFWIRPFMPLPFYGEVYDEGNFRFRLPFTLGINLNNIYYFISLKGSIDDNYNRTKINIKVCEFIKYFKYYFIVHALFIVMLNLIGFDSGTFPNFLLYFAGYLVVMYFSISSILSLIYIPRAKKMLKEILYAD